MLFERYLKIQILHGGRYIDCEKPDKASLVLTK